MIHKFMLIAILWFVGFNAFSQVNELTGTIIDEFTSEPVSNAHVVLPDGKASITDSLGVFSIEVEKMPVVIRITHISYGLSDVTILDWPKEQLIIRIKKMTSQIDEVQISGERLRILTEKTDFSLKDFAFDDKHLWMIGSINNESRKSRLWLATVNGDTLTSMKWKRPEKLILDVFGNVHLVDQDSIHQLFSNNDEIYIVSTLAKDAFYRTMSPIKAAFGDKLIYSTFLPQMEGLFTYFRTGGTDVPYILNSIRDTEEEFRQEDDFIGYSWSAGQDFNANFAMGQRKLRSKLLINKKVVAPVFVVRDTLWIMNLYKDSLLAYNQEGKLSKAISFSFHRKNYLLGTEYYKFQILKDKSSGLAYFLLRRNMEWAISQIDLSLGKLLEQIPLPNYPGMERITVFRNSVYFLYPEKKYPYYMRLYRFQI